MDPNQQKNLAQQPVQQSVSQQVVEVSKKKSMHKILLIILGIVILSGVAGGAYYLGTKQNTSFMISNEKKVSVPPKQTITGSPSNSPSPTPDPTADWKTYSYSNLG